MFSRLKKLLDTPQAAPVEPPALAGTSASSSMEGKIDLLGCLAGLMRARGHPVTVSEGALQTPEGLVIRPQAGDLRPEGAGVATTTAIETSHPVYFPDGVLERQDASGADLHASVVRGFKSWMELDLTVLMEATLPKPFHCTSLNVPVTEGPPRIVREMLAGPVVCHSAHEPETYAMGHYEPSSPWVFLLESVEAMQPILDDDRFHGVRFYAARDAEGRISVEYRVNGEDWPPGAALLREFAATWPQRGSEFRKQYAVIQPAGS
jgi:hypothetical protein